MKAKHPASSGQRAVILELALFLELPVHAFGLMITFNG